MSATYTITNDPTGAFLNFFTQLTDFINVSYAQIPTMQLSAPGGQPGAGTAPTLATGSNVENFSLTPSGGGISAGTAQPAPAKPTITVSSSGGTNNRFAITGDTNGLFNSYFLNLTNFLLANYAVPIIMELSAAGIYPGAPVQNFNSVKTNQSPPFPVLTQPTITIS